MHGHSVYFKAPVSDNLITIIDRRSVNRLRSRMTPGILLWVEDFYGKDRRSLFVATGTGKEKLQSVKMPEGPIFECAVTKKMALNDISVRR